MALIYHEKLDKIYIYPCGGIIKLYIDINVFLKEELLILISGPLIQIIFTIMCKYLVDINTYKLVYYYSSYLLIFNMLPIYPLDGGKIMKVLLDKIFSYKLSLQITLILSLIFIILLASFNISNIKLNIIIIVLFLLIKLNTEYQKKDYYYNKFILERYLNNYPFSKRCIVNNINKFKRDYKHIIKKDRYYSEKEYLNDIYK